MRIALTKFTKRIWYIFASFAVLAAILVGIGRMLTPYLNEHLVDVEGLASRLLNVPLTINRVYISWDIYEPQLAFDKVTLLDGTTHQPALEIDHIHVNVNFIKTMITRTFSIDKIHASGVHLSVHQTQENQWNLAGLTTLSISDDITQSDVTKEMIAWALSLPYVKVQNIFLDYASIKNIKLNFIANKIVIKNHNDKHQLFADIGLKQALETHAKIKLNWQGDITDVPHLKLQSYIYLEGVDLSQWISDIPLDHLHITQGVGSIKLTSEWQDNAWQSMQAIFQSYQLGLKSAVTQETLTIPSVSGQIKWYRDKDIQVVEGEKIFLDLSSHLWPEMTFSAKFKPDAAGQTNLDAFSISYVNLNDVETYFLKLGLIPADIVSKMSQYHLAGELMNLEVENILQQSLVLKTDFSHLMIKDDVNKVSLLNLTGNAQWHGDAGSVKLASQNTSFIIDSIFMNPIKLNQLQGDFQIRRDEKQTWTIQAKNLKVSNQDIVASAAMSLQWSLQEPALIDLTGNFTLLRAAQISHYLPLKIFDAGLVTWLQHAFLSGNASSGTVIVKGKLADFPFDKNNGEFNISGIVHNVDFLFAPDWPVLKGLSGKLIFSGSKMQAEVDQGTLLNVPINSAKAEIPYLGGDQPNVVNVQGVVKSDLQNAIRFLRESPLQKILGINLGRMQLTGDMNLTLSLSIPLKNPEAISVSGDVDMPNANLLLPQWKISLDQLTGKLHFTEKEITSTPIKGKLFNEAATIELATQHPVGQSSYLLANLSTHLAVDSLKNWAPVSLSNYATGKAAVNAALSLYSGQDPQVNIQSDLKGISLNLPSPYGKKAEESRNLQIQLATRTRDLFAKIHYDKTMSAAIVLDQNKQGELQFESGEISLGGEADFQKQPGLVLTVNYPEISWDALQAQISSSGKTQVSMLRSINLNVGKFTLFGQQLNQLQAVLARQHEGWQVTVKSREATGTVYVPDSKQRAIRADFSELNIATGPNTNKSASFSAKNLPAIVFDSDQTRINGGNLGHVSFALTPEMNGMNIQDLQIESAFAVLEARGSWIGSGNKQATRLSGNLKTPQLSKFLESWNLGSSNFIANQAELHFDLSWAGAPYQFSVASLSGNASISIGQGRIVNLGESTNAKLDVGRLLNIFNLNEIPRRLSLDFSDVVQKGYSFDSIKGDFDIKNGNAYTTNMRLNGPIAGIDIAGRIGLAAKDIDAKMGVTAYVTSSLPVVATVAAGLNPIAGIATWAVDKMVGTAVPRSATYQYTVKGPWNNLTWGKR